MIKLEVSSNTCGLSFSGLELERNWFVGYMVMGDWKTFVFSPFTEDNQGKLIIRMDDYRKLKKISSLDADAICYCHKDIVDLSQDGPVSTGDAALWFYNTGTHRLDDFLTDRVLNERLVSLD